MPNPSGRRPTARLLISPETATVAEAARIEVIAAILRDVSKTDVADAMITVARRHMSEVIDLLREEAQDE